MSPTLKNYLKAAILLIVLFLLKELSPDRTVDPWSLLNPRNIFQLIFALALLQVLGDLFLRFLGAKSGSIAFGFLGGLVSSTALTATLAKESKEQDEPTTRAASLAFLSATLAMIIEAAMLVFYGSTAFNPEILIVVAGPTFITLILLLRAFLKTKESHFRNADEGKIDFRSVLKLGAFILIAIAVSNALVSFFGAEATLPVTLVMSFFEIHGSIIANVQLHEAAVISTPLLGALIATSFIASFVSKLVLTSSLGSHLLFQIVRRWIIYLVGVTIASYGIFLLYGAA
jgi:uncharacterized membrane protein (DUF4010 family)